MAGTSTGGMRRETWVALLRGINLGARNKVSMADLRATFFDLEAEDVRTYLQSGNVVFSRFGEREDLARAIENEIRDRLDLELTVVLRTPADLDRVVAANPFAGHEADPTKLHVTFLAEPPERGRVEALEGNRFEPDAFHVTREEVYLHCPHGYGRSKLGNAFLERQLAVQATTRNWRTVTALSALASA